MPKWIPPAVIVLIAVSLVPAALIKRARSTHSPVPRINIIPDMDSQPSFRAQSANGMFADGR
ncbi:MAG: hypothetical protein QGH59_10185, partial [Gemmatimonadota bacterium]|nr:hypothetical protein [Gemmatimonadota bacterium]